MQPAAIILFFLASTNALLAAALAVAWRRFGRAMHAALWAGAYALAAANWFANLAATAVLPGDAWLTFLSTIFSIASFALIAMGFRRRAGLAPAGRLIGGAAIIVVLLSAGVEYRFGEVGMQRALVLGFCAAMLTLSALPLRPRGRRRRSTVAGAAFWMLAFFAGFTAALSGLALLMPISGYQPARALAGLVTLLGVPTGLFGVGLFAILLLAADLAETLRRIAASDPLTGILNRRGFEQVAGALFTRCRDEGRSVAVAIADVDRFKAINDRFGHSVGDAILRRFSAKIRSELRPVDVFGRLGGEEFGIMLPGAGGADAMSAVEALRTNLTGLVSDLVAEGVTVSFGVATLDDPDESLGDMMQRADQALYRSKMDGRDRVTMQTPAAQEPYQVERMNLRRHASRA